MKAIVLEKAGGLEQLKIRDVEQPTISAGEVLVAVKCIGINPVDFKVRGAESVLNMIYGEERPAVIGWDIAGVVTETGAGVSRFKVGDEVFGMVNFPGAGRAYAEYVAAPAEHLALKPGNVSFEEAAAATLPALTAYQALVESAGVKPGDKVLVQAASGGVGHYAVQIAKHLGAEVTGISSGKNRAFVLGLGADAHIDYKKENFEEILSELDFVLEALGGEYIDRSLNVVRAGGTLISIPSPLTEEQEAMAKAKGVNASFMLVRSNGSHMDQLSKWLEDGTLKSHIHSTFRFDQMGKAHEQLESGRTVGKVVVVIGD